MSTLLNETRSHGTWSPFGSTGDDRFAITIPTQEVFQDAILTITGQRGIAGARVDAKPTAGATGPQEVRVRWWHEGGSEIDFRVEAVSAPKGTGSVISVRVPGFLPSTCGFQFSNSGLPSRPDLVLDTKVAGLLPIGDASNGLCGGMVYTVRDYFEAHLPIPPGAKQPDSGPLFDYVVRRLFDSFDIPAGVVKYLELMNPVLPDHDTWESTRPGGTHGRAWRMIVDEWPLIKQDLDAGRLSTLSLVGAKSANPADLGKSHQVLAYGYDLRGTRLSLLVYDPNRPGVDGITLSIDLDQPEHSKVVTYEPMPVVCFFRSNYRVAPPPGSAANHVRAALVAKANGRLVCAENAGAQPLIANRTQVGPWETFELCVVGSTTIALRAQANGRYVCADQSGAMPLVANRDRVGPWETFACEYVPVGGLALRSMANDRYVCADGAGARALIANRTKIGPWETFTVRYV